MYMSLQKKVMVAAVMLMSLQGMQAMVNHFERVGKRAATPNGLFNKFVIHPFASNTARGMVSDTLLFQKGTFQLHLHEIVDVLTAMFVESLNDKLCGSKNVDALDSAKLVAIGAVLHKFAAEAFIAAGLNNCFTQETKDAYGVWGAGYMEGILACIVDEFFNPDKYKKDEKKDQQAATA